MGVDIFYAVNYKRRSICGLQRRAAGGSRILNRRPLVDDPLVHSYKHASIIGVYYVPEQVNFLFSKLIIICMGGSVV